jgi:hypothetical protein
MGTWNLSYDASGDVLNDGVNTYLYDAEGTRLHPTDEDLSVGTPVCAVAGTPIPGMTVMTGYLYGAGGTRVAKGSITAWSCDPAANGFQTINDYVLGLGGEQVTEMGMGSVTTGSTASSCDPAAEAVRTGKEVPPIVTTWKALARTFWGYLGRRTN